jgi:inorganic pyrophosphatase
MRHFFTVYKNLEGKDTDVNEVGPREEAIAVIKDAIENYIQEFCK